MKQAELRYLTRHDTHPLIARLYLIMVSHTDFKTGLCSVSLGTLESKLAFEPGDKRKGASLTATKKQIIGMIEQLEKADLLQTTAQHNAKNNAPKTYKLTYHGPKNSGHRLSDPLTPENKGLQQKSGHRLGNDRGTGRGTGRDTPKPAETKGCKDNQGIDRGIDRGTVSSNTRSPIYNARGEILTAGDLIYDNEFSTVTQAAGLINEIEPTWQQFIGHHESKFTTCLKSQWLGHWRKWAARQKVYQANNTGGNHNAKRNSNSQQSANKPKNGTAQIIEYARAASAGYTGEDW